MYIIWKKFIKKNKKIREALSRILSRIIYFYLRFVYTTSITEWIYHDDYDRLDFISSKKVVFALWHDKLAMGPRIFQDVQNTAALASSHSDGKVISEVIRKFGFSIIEGSCNRNSVRAALEIIKALRCGMNVVITPDGPRGPKHSINGNIIRIVQKTGALLVPVSYSSSRCFKINSWDKLIMPLPFSRVQIKIGEPIKITTESDQNHRSLYEALQLLEFSKLL